MHRMTHPQFTCTVTPAFLAEQSDVSQGVYAFSYTVTVVNTGDVAGQLIGRHWVIVDGAGHVEEVRGLGVVGHQPMLKPGERFEYTSWTRLATPRGRMKGTYFCMTEDVRLFEADIPEFELSQARALH
ncbi:MAG: Co2+/Mg2+ efflux protein ApaG [Pseudomonadota bacterium]|jgi:ApaG protein|nr:ApaG protein [Pseudomonadota bacterium]